MASVTAILRQMLTKREAEQQLSGGAVVIPMARDLVVTTGEDAASFLNGQLSQAIEPMSIGQSSWSMLLEPQGKFGFWLRVTRIDDQEFWLDVDAGQGEAMLARLNRFLLRTKAAFELTQASCFAVRGSDLPERPAATPTQVSVDIGWTGVGGFDVIGTSVEQPDGELTDSSLLEALRVADGVPTIGAEILPSTIPAETGIVDISASFSKGCYTGQELVARVNSRGNNTPRKIHRAQVHGAVAPEAGASVLVAGEAVGELTSVAELDGAVVGLVSLKRGTMADELEMLAGQVTIGSDHADIELRRYQPLVGQVEG